MAVNLSEELHTEFLPCTPVISSILDYNWDIFEQKISYGFMVCICQDFYFFQFTTSRFTVFP